MTLMAFMRLFLKKLLLNNRSLVPPRAAFVALVASLLAIPGSPFCFAAYAQNKSEKLDKIEDAKASTQAAEKPTAATAIPSNPALTVPQTSVLPWKSDGEKFESYAVFKDELFAAIGKAKKRVAVVTQYLSDGDLATALYMAKIRGVIVIAVLDSREARKVFSRHNYLARTGVPTYLRKLSGTDMGGSTTVVIDDAAWRLDVHLDDKNSGGVRIDRSASTADEVFAWSSGPGVEQATFQPPPALRKAGPGANTSTRLRRRAQPASDTINDENRKQSGASIPRRLPRETRSQRLRDSGTRSNPQSPASPADERLVKVPAPPANESELTE